MDSSIGTLASYNDASVGAKRLVVPADRAVRAIDAEPAAGALIGPESLSVLKRRQVSPLAVSPFTCHTQAPSGWRQ